MGANTSEELSSMSSTFVALRSDAPIISLDLQSQDTLKIPFFISHFWLNFSRANRNLRFIKRVRWINAYIRICAATQTFVYKTSWLTELFQKNMIKFLTKHSCTENGVAILFHMRFLVFYAREGKTSSGTALLRPLIFHDHRKRTKFVWNRVAYMKLFPNKSTTTKQLNPDINS